MIIVLLLVMVLIIFLIKLLLLKVMIKVMIKVKQELWHIISSTGEVVKLKLNSKNSKNSKLEFTKVDYKVVYSTRPVGIYLPRRRDELTSSLFYF